LRQCARAREAGLERGGVRRCLDRADRRSSRPLTASARDAKPDANLDSGAVGDRHREGSRTLRANPAPFGPTSTRRRDARARARIRCPPHRCPTTSGPAARSRAYDLRWLSITRDGNSRPGGGGGPRLRPREAIVDPRVTAVARERSSQKVAWSAVPRLRFSQPRAFHPPRRAAATERATDEPGQKPVGDMRLSRAMRLAPVPRARGVRRERSEAARRHLGGDPRGHPFRPMAGVNVPHARQLRGRWQSARFSPAGYPTARWATRHGRLVGRARGVRGSGRFASTVIAEAAAPRSGPAGEPRRRMRASSSHLA